MCIRINGVEVLGHVTLAVQHLQDEYILLHQGGLYWIALDHASDAQALARQFLAALPYEQGATLMCVGSEPQALVEPLPLDCGPATLRLFSIDAKGLASTILPSLIVDFQRLRVRPGSQLILMLPSAWLENFDSSRRHEWLMEMRQWLLSQACTLLVLSSGQSPKLHACLLQLNEQLSGLAQLYRQDGAIRYQLNYWHSPLGVCAAQSFELDLLDKGFALSAVQRSLPVQARSDDQRIYLTERLALGGAAPLSEQWRLFEHRDELLQQAVNARAASVIVAVESNQEVEALALQLHELRERCGMALKIIVREMEPCLRYRDERLLLASGANLLVPCDTTLARFLSLVESVQGQIWRYRQSTNIEALLERLRPPAQRGLLAAADFLALVDQVYSGAAGELEHQLLRLHPRGDLPIEQYLGQISLRRYGDVACVVDGQFYLFLFGCRRDGLEPALGNVCRLPWADLFAQYSLLAGADSLPRQRFEALDGLPDRALHAQHLVTSDLQRSIAKAGYVPQRLTLMLSEPSA